MTTFDLIKKVSKERGYSLRQTAEKAGLGETSLYHWKYKTPSASNLAKVAKALNVSTDYLLGNDEKSNEKPRIKELARKMEEIDERDLDSVEILLNKMVNDRKQGKI